MKHTVFDSFPKFSISAFLFAIFENSFWSLVGMLFEGFLAFLIRKNYQEFGRECHNWWQVRSSGKSFLKRTGEAEKSFLSNPSAASPTIKERRQRPDLSTLARWRAGAGEVHGQPRQRPRCRFRPELKSSRLSTWISSHCLPDSIPAWLVTNISRQPAAWSFCNFVFTEALHQHQSFSSIGNFPDFVLIIVPSISENGRMTGKNHWKQLFSILKLYLFWKITVLSNLFFEALFWKK